jgi:tyrosyl-tRNA synthetase
MNVYDVLQERGFIQQVSHEEIRDILGQEKVTFYIGFDATADSLHVGHYVQLMAMAHLQRAGHRPIALVGGGTTLVGDPSGKTDMRKMMTRETINENAAIFKRQIAKFLDFSDGKAIMEDNANWLLDLNYIEFLRDIGVHFSVNRMLAAECFKQRLERGLTFFEFNYMLMQSYDFLVLFRKYGCTLELGGDDQWANILAGADLIRRKEGAAAFAMTFTLLATSDGRKMGKTEKGAVWLSPEKTSPYEFYQYWRNIDDQDVEKCLSLLTFLPMDEVRRLASLEDAQINQAKTVLAFEITRQVHGEEEAQKAAEASRALFSGTGSDENMPSAQINQADYLEDSRVVHLMVLAGLSGSKGEARRLIQGGGVFIDDKKVTDVNQSVEKEALQRSIIIRKGKKTYCRLTLS